VSISTNPHIPPAGKDIDPSEEDPFPPFLKPDITQLRGDLLSVISHMHHSLRHIDRIERLIFPLLTLRTKYLQEPQL
jgi:hypothetical protein